MLGIPLKSDSPFIVGILLKPGRVFVVSMLGLCGRRLLFKASMALCSKSGIANKIGM
jgi:hypothetical protein